MGQQRFVEEEQKKRVTNGQTYRQDGRRAPKVERPSFFEMMISVSKACRDVCSTALAGTAGAGRQTERERDDRTGL